MIVLSPEQETAVSIFCSWNIGNVADAPMQLVDRSSVGRGTDRLLTELCASVHISEAAATSVWYFLSEFAKSDPPEIHATLDGFADALGGLATLVGDIRERKPLSVSAEMRQLAREVVADLADREEVDIDDWSKQLAKDFFQSTPRKR